MTREAGKGDAMRPTDHKAYSQGFDNVFSKRPEPYKVTCERCAKELWLDPDDVYSGAHTCTLKDGQSV